MTEAGRVKKIYFSIHPNDHIYIKDEHLKLTECFDCGALIRTERSKSVTHELFRVDNSRSCRKYCGRCKPAYDRVEYWSNTYGENEPLRFYRFVAQPVAPYVRINEDGTSYSQDDKDD
ncbi:hypothetical protein LCGC14_0311140 [marine sediment metagenome]|uniref:Uncharacterized protein n=1 Tax=marine sediment metagenome TaxID=412755 RepID=A0A0F9W9G9_9ZZZZ